MRTPALRITSLALGLCLTLAACAQPDGSETPGTGGSGEGSGGEHGGQGGSGTGGSPGTGGMTGSGGAKGTGGINTTGTGGTGTGGGVAGTGGGGGMIVGGGTGGRGTGGTATGTGGAGGSVPSMSKLPTPPGAANMPKPSGTAGNITVVNWAGFKGAVTYSFDDSNSSQIQHYSELKALGVPFTFFMWTGKSDASNTIWATALADGHELANHTQSHSSNGTGADVDAATAFIKSKFGVQAWTMAAPNGASVYTGLANGRFMINRGVSDSVIAPNGSSDPFTLPTYIPPAGAAASAFNGEVDSARTAGGWRTMCVHGFTGGSDGAYQPVPIAEFIAGVQHAKSLGDMWIDTMTNVGAYWRGQKAFSSATTTMSGTDKTWTWKLPGNFPPGKYLRVTVPGGTVKQNGAELAWDPHGYYEIALDALSVTVSP